MLGLLTRSMLCKLVELAGGVCGWACKGCDACVHVGAASLSCLSCMLSPTLTSPFQAQPALWRSLSC